MRRKIFPVTIRRAGHLFQGRYRVILVETDEYAGELSRYIHLNPVRAGMVQGSQEHPWSSYAAYAGKKKPPDWLTTDRLLGYFGKETPHRDYEHFVNQRLCKKSWPVN